MKKVILFFLIAFFATNVFSQQTTAPPLTKADYLQKSKGQKTAAWILLGVGVTCAAIAAPGNVSLDALPVLIIGGGAAAIGSIPLFIAAAKNKKRAGTLAAFIKMETRSSLQKYSMSQIPYPAISVRFSL